MRRKHMRDDKVKKKQTNKRNTYFRLVYFFLSSSSPPSGLSLSLPFCLGTVMYVVCVWISSYACLPKWKCQCAPVCILITLNFLLRGRKETRKFHINYDCIKESAKTKYRWQPTVEHRIFRFKWFTALRRFSFVPFSFRTKIKIWKMQTKINNSVADDEIRWITIKLVRRRSRRSKAFLFCYKRNHRSINYCKWLRK